MPVEVSVPEAEEVEGTDIVAPTTAFDVARRIEAEARQKQAEKDKTQVTTPVLPALEVPELPNEGKALPESVKVEETSTQTAMPTTPSPLTISELRDITPQRVMEILSADEPEKLLPKGLDSLYGREVRALKKQMGKAGFHTEAHEFFAKVANQIRRVSGGKQ